MPVRAGPLTHKSLISRMHMKKYLFAGALAIGLLFSTSQAFAYTWTQATSAGIGNWASNAIIVSADGSRMAAGGAVTLSNQVYASTDNGVTWGPESGTTNMSALAGSADGSHLVGGANGGYVYTSTDYGATWIKHTSLGIGAWFSASSDASGQNIAVGDYNGYIYTSTDGGTTWSSHSSASGAHKWSGMASDATGMHLVAASGGSYIYTSSNGGLTWTADKSSGSHYWGSVASDASGMNLVAVYQNDYIYRSTDGGATWTTLSGSGVRRWSGVTSDASGYKLAATDNGGYIYTSLDAGATWTAETSAGKDNWWGIASSADGYSLAAGTDAHYLWTTTPYVGPNKTKVIVSTLAATSITATTATINGYLDADGGAPTTTVGFSYGPTKSYGFSASAPNLAMTGPFSANLTSLTCGTTYHYVASASNMYGSGFGYDVSFTTLACSGGGGIGSGTVTSATAGTTTVSTGGAVVITPWTGSHTFTKTFATGATGADVVALQQYLQSQGYFTVSPNGIYGPITTKAVTAFQNAMNITPTTGGVGPRTLAALNSAINGSGSTVVTTTAGSGGSTVSVPPTPDAIIPNSIAAITTLAATSVTASSATLHGSFASLIAAASATGGFEYGTSYGYGTMVPQAAVSGTALSATLTGLTCGTTYDYASTATNASGMTNGAGMTFTTLACTK